MSSRVLKFKPNRMAGLTTCWTIHLIKIQLNGFHTALVRGMLAVLCFTLALEALRMPVVQCMDKKSTMTMLADERIDHTQQSIIKRYLVCIQVSTYSFQTQELNGIMSNILCQPTTMNVNITKKGTKCRYWVQDPSLVLNRELSRMLDCLDSNVI